jgi:hypothetical protein
MLAHVSCVGECVPRHSFPDYRGLLDPHGSHLRPALLRELTELYVQKPTHTPEEVRLYTELALRLIEHVDAADRAWVGAKLSAYPGAPLAVIQRLAQPDTPPVSSQSMALSDRPADSLPRLEDHPARDTLSDSFFNASASERQLILRYLDYAPVSPAAVDIPIGVLAQIEQAALRRQRDTFAQTLAEVLCVSLTCAKRIADDTTGEAVLAALKALALPSPAGQRILLFLNPVISQSPDTYFALVRLYEEVSEDTARRLVAIWRRDYPVQRKGEYRPEYFEAHSGHARDFARHDRRPVTRLTEEPRRKTFSEN